MLNYALHATTMNRDRDPARTGQSVDFSAFDGGPTGPSEAGADTSAAATDGGRQSDTRTDGGTPAGNDRQEER
jgi:glycerol-3-phosphate dehydrogenase